MLARITGQELCSKGHLLCPQYFKFKCSCHGVSPTSCSKFFLITPSVVFSPPLSPSALKSNSHGVCSNSLFIKEMNSICIIHFFCELFFPCRELMLPSALGTDSDRRTREQGGKNAFPHVTRTDRGQKVWPLQADTLSTSILSHQKEGGPCAGY